MIKCRLPVILAERGMKQKFLAEKINLNRSTMSLIINGQQMPTLENALRIAKALDMKVEDVWNLEE